jgi:prepilin-type N-terminal cleavage/methylation domain-containing protein
MRGFTLLETVLTLAISGIIVSASLAGGISWYERSVSSSYCESRTAALRRTRAEALHAICTNDCVVPPTHGLHAFETVTTLFEGSSYAARVISADEALPIENQTKIDSPIEAVFSPLEASAPAMTINTAPADTSSCSLSINPEGGITEPL